MRIFVAYASEQERIAEATELALREQGHDVFLGKSAVGGSDPFRLKIQDEIDACDLFVFLLSPQSISTGRFTLSELDQAQRRWRHPAGVVLPVMVARTDYADIPEYLKAVGVLEPRGDVPAEVAARVRMLSLPGATRVFDTLIAEIEQEFLADGVFLRWKPPQRSGDVSRRQLLRLGLQKLLHAAQRMDPRVTSSNVWVSMKEDDQRRPVRLRSEEREGYFPFNQLVAPDDDSVRFRSLSVLYDPTLKSKLSAAARCIVEGRAIIDSIGKTGFPSRPEKEKRTTHILGIPAERIAHEPPGCECPLAMTVDLSCEGDLSHADTEALLERGGRVSGLLTRLAHWNAERER
jgi:hypothetical protein